MDSDSSKKVDEDEFITKINLVLPSLILSPEQLHLVFKECDKDGDMLLNMSELRIQLSDS